MDDEKQFISTLLILCMMLTLLPMTATVASGNLEKDGWLYLRCMGNYLNIDTSGNAELCYKSNTEEGNTKLLVRNRGNFGFTLETANGRFLGITDTIKDGVRLKAVSIPYLWNTYNENFTGLEDRDKYSLHPPTNTKMVVNASENKRELGTNIILWTATNTDTPVNAEFTFYVLRAEEGQIPENVVTTQPSASPTNLITAYPSKTSFVMNGQPVSVTEAYNINSTNCLPLRTIAAMHNGTTAQFNVGWEGQYAVLELGKPYSGTLTKTKLQNTTNIRQSSTKFKRNGEIFSFTDAPLIDGDTNYLQLREFTEKLFGTALQFNVYWEKAAGKAIIQPSVAYTGLALYLL